jgi:large subunit ribosomal protein L21
MENKVYAIFESGGKQIKVNIEDSIFVEKLEAKPGEKVIIENVLLIYDGTKLHIGTPNLTATVTAIVQKQGRGKKLIIFRTKQKSN